MDNFRIGDLVTIDVSQVSAKKRYLYAGKTYRITKVNPKMLITAEIQTGARLDFDKRLALKSGATATPAPTTVTMPESYSDLLAQIERESVQRQDLFKKFALGTVVRHVGAKHPQWPYKDGALLVAYKVDTVKEIVNVALLGGDDNKYWRVLASDLEVVPTPK